MHLVHLAYIITTFSIDDNGGSLYPSPLNHLQLKHWRKYYLIASVCRRVYRFWKHGVGPSKNPGQNFEEKICPVDRDGRKDNPSGRVGHETGTGGFVEFDVAPHWTDRPVLARQCFSLLSALVEKSQVERNELFVFDFLLFALDDFGFKIAPRSPDLHGLGLDILPPVNVDGMVEAGRTSSSCHS